MAKMATVETKTKDERIQEYDDLLAQSIDATPKINMRAIWDDRPQVFKTYDGRVCVYTRIQLASVLGGQYAKANLAEQSAFLAYCINKGLDPVAHQVYFVRYSKDDPPNFITSWEVFLDRGVRHPQYDGHECGIVWRLKKDDDWKTERGQPCDYPVDDKHQILGAWARIYRKDKSVPDYVEVPKAEMPTQSTHKTLPTTMATKIACSRGFRKAFTSILADMYTEGESEALALAIRETEQATLQSGDTAPPATLDDLAEELDKEQPPCKPNGTVSVVGPDPLENWTEEDEKTFHESKTQKQSGLF